MRDRITELFKQHFGADPSAVVEIEGDGSQRSYYRLIGDDWQTAVGVVGPDRDENRAFLSYSRAFREIGLPVPEIYGADEEAGVWLESDLGDTTLFAALIEARRGEDGFPEKMLSVYRRIVELLPRFQVEGGRVADYSVAYPRAAFDKQSIMWDLNYFKYHFLKLAHIPFNEARLESDFRQLTGFLLRADTRHFLYRDFQSRNIMLVDDGEPCFIDYQGGRRGAPQYDIASLLHDAKADIPKPIREELFAHYLDALEDHTAVDRTLFRKHYRGYVLVRIMQALGAFGYRGFYERKGHFLQSVPYAARNIAGLLDRGLPVRLPELERVFDRIVRDWAHRRPEEQKPGLTVRVGSFSYNQGYPEDATGHGGGYIFDCRALPNPGRYVEYEELSGRDESVIDFLEERREVGMFYERTRALVDAQVREYLRRGFTSLTIGYGCTGGQHRSVYLSEQLVRHLREQFPQVNVRLVHRERGSWKSAPETEREAAREAAAETSSTPA